MPLFVIQQREPGPFDDPDVPWADVATVDVASAPEAIRTYCEHMQWYRVERGHDTVVVPGVGVFRAMPGEEAAARPFVIQRQDPPGPHDRHLTWSDYGSIRASDEIAAIRLYCEQMHWVSWSNDGNVFRPYGLGLFRVVPADLAEQMRTTPEP
jgi:hypothetical protein